MFPKGNSGRSSIFAIATFLLQSVCAQQLLTLTLTGPSTIGSSVVTVSSQVTISLVTEHNTQPLNSYEALATITETYSTESILSTLTTTATFSILTAATSPSTASGIVIVSFPSISSSQTSFVSTSAATHSASSSSSSSTPTPTNSPERHRLSSGAIGGIAVGCVAAVFFVCGGIFWGARYLRKQKERKQYTLAQPSSEKEATARTKVIQEISSPAVDRSELEGIGTRREAPATSIVELQGLASPEHELSGTGRTY